MKQSISISELKQILSEGYEDTQFPLDWKTMDTSNWEQLIHDYIAKYGWKRMFKTSAFAHIQSPSLILNMLENGFSINTTDEEFEKLLIKAMKTTDVIHNTHIMKDFVGSMLLRLSGRDSGRIF